MKEKALYSVVLLVVIFLSSSVMLGVKTVYAVPSISIQPSSAFVGQYRTIMVYVKAADPPALGVVSVELLPLNVPFGVHVWFDPSYVSYTNTIESTMYVYAGPNATAGSYTIIVKAIWTNWAGPKWSTTANFNVEVRAANEVPWTSNPDLTMNQFWIPNNFNWDWVLGTTWSNLPNSWNLYVNWPSNGQVNMNATDPHSDFIGVACEFAAECATKINLNTSTTSLSLTAAVSNYGSNHPGLPSWSGIKFDLWAFSRKDQRELYIEMYFDRQGVNTYWWPQNPGNNIEIARTLSLGTIDDYLVDIIDPTFTTTDRSVKIQNVGGVTSFTADLGYFFARAARLFREYYGAYFDTWGDYGGRTMNDYCIHKVGVTLEAALIGLESNGLPSTWATLRSLSVKRSYLGDVNCDGYINSADISLVQGSLNSQFGSSNYLPAADINKDKSINQADLNLVAQFPDYGWLTVTVPQAPDKGYDTDGTPREPVTVWLDGTQYALYKSTSARVLRTVGQNYRIQAQTSFVKEEWTPGTYFIYKFSYWSDGSTDNPHTFTNFAGDTTRSPFYRRLPYGIR